MGPDHSLDEVVATWEEADASAGTVGGVARQVVLIAVVLLLCVVVAAVLVFAFHVP